MPVYLRDGKLLIVDGKVATGSGCCCPPPCPPDEEGRPPGYPTEWAIVDYTSGWNVMLSGNTLYTAIPQIWRGRGYVAAPPPATMSIGLFVKCDDSAGCVSWVVAEAWTMTPSTCAGGSWWSPHSLSDVVHPCSEYGDAYVNLYPDPEFMADAFYGTVDSEWANMANWGPYWNNLYLPDSSQDVLIYGSALGNSAGSASCQDLTLLGDLGITINCATAYITGRVLSAAQNTFCPSPADGHVNASGNVSLNGSAVNNGQITGATVEFNGTSANYGTVNGNAVFNDASSNFGTVTGTITCNTTGTCP